MSNLTPIVNFCRNNNYDITEDYIKRVIDANITIYSNHFSECSFIENEKELQDLYVSGPEKNIDLFVKYVIIISAFEVKLRGFSSYRKCIEYGTISSGREFFEKMRVINKIDNIGSGIKFKYLEALCKFSNETLEDILSICIPIKYSRNLICPKTIVKFIMNGDMSKDTVNSRIKQSLKCVSNKNLIYLCNPTYNTPWDTELIIRNTVFQFIDLERLLRILVDLYFGDGWDVFSLEFILSHTAKELISIIVKDVSEIQSKHKNGLDIGTLIEDYEELIEEVDMRHELDGEEVFDDFYEDCLTVLCQTAQKLNSSK